MASSPRLPCTEGKGTHRAGSIRDEITTRLEQPAGTQPGEPGAVGGLPQCAAGDGEILGSEMEIDSNRNEPSHFISEVCQQADNAISLMKMAPDKVRRPGVHSVASKRTARMDKSSIPASPEELRSQECLSRGLKVTTHAAHYGILSPWPHTSSQVPRDHESSSVTSRQQCM
ncbi:uncharacterized protein LJ206_018518 [Theristicus caerulescens]